MYKKFIPILILLFLFIGCSQKYNEYAKSTDIVREQALTLTQKAVIKEGINVKAFIVVTYINKIDHKLVEQDESKEKFIVSIHIQSEENKELYEKISFSVNGEKDYIVTPLSNDAKILQILPAVASWNKYFLVEAQKKPKTRGVSFEVFIANYSTGNMSFHDDYGNLPFTKSNSVLK